MRASLPGGGDRADRARAAQGRPGHYVIGGAPLAPAGDWTLEFVARVSEFDEQRAEFVVPVR